MDEADKVLELGHLEDVADLVPVLLVSAAFRLLVAKEPELVREFVVVLRL